MATARARRTGWTVRDYTGGTTQTLIDADRQTSPSAGREHVWATTDGPSLPQAAASRAVPGAGVEFSASSPRPCGPCAPGKPGRRRASVPLRDRDRSGQPEQQPDPADHARRARQGRARRGMRSRRHRPGARATAAAPSAASTSTPRPPSRPARSSTSWSSRTSTAARSRSTSRPSRSTRSSSATCSSTSSTPGRRSVTRQRCSGPRDGSWCRSPTSRTPPYAWRCCRATGTTPTRGCWTARTCGSSPSRPSATCSRAPAWPSRCCARRCSTRWRPQEITLDAEPAAGPRSIEWVRQQPDALDYQYVAAARVLPPGEERGPRPAPRAGGRLRLGAAAATSTPSGCATSWRSGTAC